MSETHGFQEHWLNIDPERIERCEMYQWNPASELFYVPAKSGGLVDLEAGQLQMLDQVSERFGVTFAPAQGTR
jgi:hypothetical protein